MAWFLYMIECRDGSLYTGITVDVAARYAAHAAGTGARYTRARPPARLLLTLPYPDRSTASKAEYAVKQFTPKQKRAYIRDCLAVQALERRAQQAAPQARVTEEKAPTARAKKPAPAAKTVAPRAKPAPAKQAPAKKAPVQKAPVKKAPARA